jgi:hypothetical protein
MPAVSVSPSVSTEIVPEDYGRTCVVITNTHSSSNLHISFQEAATTDHAYIGPLGNMTLAGDGVPKCKINGISSSGAITANYSKLSSGR